MKNIIFLTMLFFATACVTSKKQNGKNSNSPQSIHAIWSLVAVNSEKINPVNFERIPNIEFNITENTFNGHDGCNSYSGELKKITAKEIILGPMISTEKYCDKMNATEEYVSLLKNVSRYVRKEMKLYLKDENDKSILTFQKVD